MLNINARQSECDNLRSEVQIVNSRLDAIEAKIGGPNEVAERLGLAIQNLPYPSQGYSDIDVVRYVFSVIQGPGVNVLTDVVKAIQKLVKKNSSFIPFSSSRYCIS